MTPAITVQLFSVRTLAEKDYEGTLRAIADMGFGCVEPAGYPGSTPQKAAQIFKSLGLKAPSAHIALPIGENKNKVIDEALLMGHRYLITGASPGSREDCTSMDKVKAMTELYCQAAQNAAAHGLQVGYHNHDWDVSPVEGVRPHEYFLENTPENVLFEADIFWVARAGLDPVAFLEAIGPRGKVLHFKDGITVGPPSSEWARSPDLVGDAIPFRAAGQGQVDLLSASKAARYAEYIGVELDKFNGEMLDGIRASYQYLTANGIAVGTK